MQPSRDERGNASTPHADARPQSPPPKVRAHPSRAIALIASSIIFAGLLLVVVMNIEPAGSGDQDDAAVQITELIPPEALRPLDLTGTEPSTAEDQMVDLPAGGWIQIADPETGELAQQYRFERLDPSPPELPSGWLVMNRPRAELYLSRGRVVALSGDSAVAFAPNRALESGTITGNVVIRLFEPEGETPVDVEADTPVVVVTTAEAQFDNILGEVRCDGAIRVEHDMVTVPGRAMRLLVNDQDGSFRLSMAEVDFVALRAPPEPTDEQAGDTPTPADTVAQAGSAPGTPRQPASAASATPTAPTAPTAPAVASAAPARAAQAGPPEATVDEETRFYRLTLHDDVRVEQGDVLARRVLAGDALAIVFTPQSEGVDLTTALHAPGRLWPIGGAAAPGVIAAAPRPAPGLLVTVVSMAIASVPPAPAATSPMPDADTTVITCRGGMTIEPILDETPPLASPKDALVEMIGTPVLLTDEAERSAARCATLRYSTSGDLVELLASSAHEMQVDAPRLAAGGDRFFYSAAANAAGFTGRGWLEPRDAPGIAQVEVLDPMLDPVLELVAPTRDAPSGDATAPRDVRITWNDGVDLGFDEPVEDEQTGALRRARFMGDVAVDSRDGHIRCAALDLELETDEGGEPVPHLMTAAGDVELGNPDQTVWTDELRVTFRDPDEPADTTDGEPAPSGELAPDGGLSPLGGASDVDTVTATGNVQIALADGSRAFADRLFGDAAAETLELTGDDVALAAERVFIDGGTTVLMSRQDGRAHWPGAGRARIYGEPIMLPSSGRIERPAPADDAVKPQVNARWSESMVFDGAVNDGAGAIDLVGDVVAESSPDPLEYNRMTGRTLRLEFAHAEDAGALPSAGDLSGGDRVLGSLVARGDARLESRSWLLEDHGDVPRIFYVAGPSVAYDDRTKQADVDGAGELLVRDPRPDDAGDAAGAGDGRRSAPFSAKGTTLFRWAEGLHMEPRGDETFDIMMTGDVRAMHKGLDGTTATMTADHLEARARREIVDDAPEDAPSEEMLDLGGPMTLERIVGDGQVFIRTTERDVSCGRFDYDVVSGLARLEDRISVLTRGSPHPIRADMVLWNMQRDTITIESGRGAGAPSR